MNQAFWRLVKNIPLNLLIKLMNIHALCEKVYVYDSEAKAAVRPTPKDTPWPVLLLLGAFSVKHIFFASKNPGFADLFSGTLEFASHFA